MKKSIKVNAILNLVKSGLAIIFPLITYPYALRVLGAEGIGKVSYTSSIISYFSLIAMLGVSTYAIREGSKIRENKEEFSKFVNEVFSINVITTIISYLLLIIVIVFFKKLHVYIGLLALQSLSILFTTLGVDWINTIYEDFLKITIRSIIIYVVSLIVLFTLVKKANDIYWYAMLTVLTNGIICIFNWIYIKKYVKLRFIWHNNIKKHLKSLLILFSNAVAISIYVNFDTTMLGWMKGDYSVGLYTVSVKIYSIVKSLMVAIYSVTLPRLSLYIGNNQIDEYKQTFSDLCGYISILLIPCAIGLINVSKEIMIIMGGEGFGVAASSLKILSISLIFAIFGGLITAVLNITLGMEKENLKATIYSAFINCILNLIFIPKFSQNGAAVTTLISEAFVFVYCFIKIPNKFRYIDLKKVGKTIIKSLIASLSIFFISYIVRNLFNNIIVCIILIILISIISYVLILRILKEEYILNLNALFKLKLKDWNNRRWNKL